MSDQITRPLNKRLEKTEGANQETEATLCTRQNTKTNKTHHRKLKKTRGSVG